MQIESNNHYHYPCHEKSDVVPYVQLQELFAASRYCSGAYGTPIASNSHFFAHRLVFAESFGNSSNRLRAVQQAHVYVDRSVNHALR